MVDMVDLSIVFCMFKVYQRVTIQLSIEAIESSVVAMNWPQEIGIFPRFKTVFYQIGYVGRAWSSNANHNVIGIRCSMIGLINGLV